MQQVDERQEKRAVEPVFVEVARRHVRGRHHHHAELEQLGEQPAEDHGVGNVGDVKFVEAQQPGFVGDRDSGALDRVLLGQVAVLDFLAVAVNAFMNVGHELVEMRPALALARARLEEQVHQHGLAAADLAVDVEALERRPGLFALAEQPAERGRLARQPVLLQPPLERAEMARQRGLAGVGLDLSGGDKRRVAGAEIVGHG